MSAFAATLESQPVRGQETLSSKLKPEQQPRIDGAKLQAGQRKLEWHGWTRSTLIWLA